MADDKEKAKPDKTAKAEPVNSADELAVNASPEAEPVGATDEQAASAAPEAAAPESPVGGESLERPQAETAAPEAPPATPVTPPAAPARRLNPVHIVLPIVLMVVALAGIIAPLAYAHSFGAGRGPGIGNYQPGNNKSGSNNATVSPTRTRPSGSPTKIRPSAMPSGMPTTMPSDMPSGMPTTMPTRGQNGGPTCTGQNCPQVTQGGRGGQRLPEWPRGNRTMTGISAWQIASVSASSVVFVVGLVYLIVALRRRSALARAARE